MLAAGGRKLSVEVSSISRDRESQRPEGNEKGRGCRRRWRRKRIGNGEEKGEEEKKSSKEVKEEAPHLFFSTTGDAFTDISLATSPVFLASRLLTARKGYVPCNYHFPFLKRFEFTADLM